MNLSTIPPRPPSSSTLILDGWTLLRRPDTLSFEEFSQALCDLEASNKLRYQIIDGNVYVRWFQ